MTKKEPKPIEEIFVSRVELLYRAGINCPLREITHEWDGRPKAEWERFTKWQDAIFCAWIVPRKLPQAIQRVTSLYSSAVLVTSARYSTYLVLDEAAISTCRGSLNTFIKTLEFFLKNTEENTTFFLHRKKILERNEPPTRVALPSQPFKSRPCQPNYRPRYRY